MNRPRPEAGRAARAIVLALLFLLLVLAVALAYSRSRRSSPAGRPAQAEGQAFASGEAPSVVFIDTLAGRLAVSLRGPGEAQPRSLYQAQTMAFEARLPDEFGLLPSPDGKYLLVWEADGARDRTHWTLLLLPKGEEISSGDSPGAPRILPRWQEEGTLALVGNAALSIVNPEFLMRWMHLDHTFRLPKPIPDAALPKALLAYEDRYLDPSSGAFSRLLRAPARQTRLATYLATRGRSPDHYLLLRGTGLPGGGVLRNEKAPGGIPELAYTPDGKRFALANEARLAAFETETQKQLWALPASEEGTTSEAPRFADLRWSPDGRFLSFTEGRGDASTVLVIDSVGWEKVLELPQAADAFVLP